MPVVNLNYCLVSDYAKMYTKQLTI